MVLRAVLREREARFWDRVREGMSATAACESIGVNRKQGYRWIKAAGGRIPVPRVAASGRYLALEERLRIADLAPGGSGVREIARDLGRAASTISRELRRNAHPRSFSYRPYAAQKRAEVRACRPKPGRLDDPALAAVVEERLRKNWSPQQISDDLAVVFAGHPELQVSHETIYQSLFVQGRYDEIVENSFKGDDREVGLILEPDKKQGRPTIRAYVRRWRDIIDENKRRLEFVTSSLEFDPSLAEGLAFIREEYAEMLPDSVGQADDTADLPV
jgi:transposase